RRARELGFSIEQIRALLTLADDREQSCDAVDAIARAHLGEIKRKLADLASLRRELELVIGQCRHGTIAECRIIEALAPAPPAQLKRTDISRAPRRPKRSAPGR